MAFATLVTPRIPSSNSIPLPAKYRVREVLAFHGRDPSQLAERIENGVLCKGLVLNGEPAVLTITLDKGNARYSLDMNEHESLDVREMVEHMLGLHIESEVFEKQVADDPLLGAVVGQQAGLRIPQTATAFEALTWAIIGQQIALGFAITLRRRFIELGGARHHSGLACYPDASRVARMDANELGRLQFSRAKSEALIRVARLIEDRKLDLEKLALAEPEVIFAELTAIKGIGPWTANYTLMRGLGAVDCSLHGDAAVRAAIVKLTGRSDKLGQVEAQRMLEEYRPWRSLAAAHLWASHAQNA